MNDQIDNPQTTGNKKTAAGIIILAIGILFLLKQATFFTFPVWIISWPLVLIGYGLYTGIRHDFKKSAWILYTTIGVIFLLPNIIPAFSLSMVWPLLMIAFGVKILIRRDQRWAGDHWEKRNGPVQQY